MPSTLNGRALALQICGGILMAAGTLYLIWNREEAFQSLPLAPLFVMLLGFILLLLGKRVVPVSRPREQAAKAPPAFSRAVKTSTPLPARLTTTAPEAQAQSGGQNLARLRANLSTKCMNNQKQVDRLIEYERHHNPGAGEAQLLLAAIKRWEDDNR